MTFLDALLAEAGNRRRIERIAVWRAFRAAHPVEALAGDARERLAARLVALARDGAVELPAERGAGWDRSARPPLPEWVRLPKAAEGPAAFDPLAVHWAPELGFVPALPRIDHPDDLLAIQAFFASGGRERPVIPMRERSVQIFGDEKRLDRLVNTPLFSEGRLTLAMLRCFAMAPPLVYEDGPAEARGRPVLVIENHHTWWSFCRWNAREGAYAAVVYGAGGGFGRDAVAFLAERCRVVGAPGAVYFGDLDRDGLVIPSRAATSFAPAHGLRLEPALRWYRLLLARASNARLPTGPALDEEGVEWLPTSIQDEVRSHFQAGRRIPQELVGTEELARSAVTSGVSTEAEDPCGNTESSGGLSKQDVDAPGR